MQRGSDRLSRYKDEARKHELQALLHAGHPTRDAEWYDPEPPADDDPEPANRSAPPRGAGSGAFEQLRSELGRHLGRTPFPARSNDVVRTLRERHAPDRLVEQVEARLPADGRYSTVADVTRAVSREPGGPF
ncbi:hypothetical protein GCM10020367_54210 [Streptomyces sannanensis]|uniref:DUF2795 domain-containing protein n=1 Tax=Streptomyces sannanensis TaxID=285536 RepID=A0ABP6SIQ2_9ACTN